MSFGERYFSVKDRSKSCKASHPGGYGDCIREKAHDGPHADAQNSQNTWTDADAKKIMDQRQAARDAAKR